MQMTITLRFEIIYYVSHLSMTLGKFGDKSFSVKVTMLSRATWFISKDDFSGFDVI